MKFRARPVEIEAFQMTRKRRWDNSDWPCWAHYAWNKPRGTGAIWIDPSDSNRERLIVGTLENPMRVSWNDWIVRGLRGELYPVKPGIFKRKYERVK